MGYFVTMSAFAEENNLSLLMLALQRYLTGCTIRQIVVLKVLELSTINTFNAPVRQIVSND